MDLSKIPGAIPPTKEIIKETKRILGIDKQIRGEKDKMIEETKKKKSDGNNEWIPNTRKAIKQSLNKQINGKVLVVIWFNLILTTLFNDPDFIQETPLWTKLSINTAILVVAALFNIDNPTVENIKTQIFTILRDRSIHPLKKMTEIESLFPEMAFIWDKENQKYNQYLDEQKKKD